MDIAVDEHPDCAPALVIVAGQSNALGYTLGRDDVPPHLAQPPKLVKIWRPEVGAFAPLEPGANTGTSNNPQAWGAEAQFAYRWSRDHACAPLYIVKFARGESGLAANATRRDWSPSSTGDLWDDATEEIDSAKAALAARNLPTRVRAVLWMQGETDAQSPTAAASYAANLKVFLEQARARWGDPATRIHIGQIDRRTERGWNQVRAAQSALAAKDRKTTLTDTAAFPRQTDGVHLTATGQVQLGDAFYEADRAAPP